jgi:hypothetical protein
MASCPRSGPPDSPPESSGGWSSNLWPYRDLLTGKPGPADAKKPCITTDTVFRSYKRLYPPDRDFKRCSDSSGKVSSCYSLGLYLRTLGLWAQTQERGTNVYTKEGTRIPSLL